MRTVLTDTKGAVMSRRSSRMSSAQRGNTHYRYARSVLPPSPPYDPAFDWLSDLNSKWEALEATGYRPDRGLIRNPNFLDEIEDNRRFNPDRRPRTITGNRVWIGVAPGQGRFVRRPGYYLHSRPLLARNYYTGTPVGLQLPWGLKYEGMFPVVTCVRRKIRRAVMFAKRKVGLGAKKKYRHRNERSSVRC